MVAQMDEMISCVFCEFSVYNFYLAGRHVQPTPTLPLWVVSCPSSHKRPEHRSSSPEPRGSSAAPGFLNQVLPAEQLEVKGMQDQWITCWER